MGNIMCPLCSRSFADLLKHLVLVHEVKNADHFAKLVAGVEAEAGRQKAFHDLATDLYRQVTEGKITVEEYRRRIMNWSRANT
jgi:hypothetical protein